MPDDNDPAIVVEVIQEGVSYPQASEEETKQAVQELMNELSVMDQATQTPPQPTLEPEDDDHDNEGMKRLVRMATIFESPAFQNLRPVPVRWTTWFAFAMRCVWRSVSLKSDENMSNVPCTLVCCFVLKRKPMTI